MREVSAAAEHFMLSAARCGHYLQGKSHDWKFNSEACDEAHAATLLRVSEAGAELADS